MISQTELFAIASAAFGQEVNLTSSQQEIQGWDSLSHLSLLVALDEATGGAASALNGLGSAKSMEQIVNILRNGKLL